MTLTNGLCNATVKTVRSLRVILWMNCHAKRLECAQLAALPYGTGGSKAIASSTHSKHFAKSRCSYVAPRFVSLRLHHNLTLIQPARFQKPGGSGPSQP